MPLLIAILFLIIIFVGYLKTPAGKGQVGEYIVRLFLGKTTPGEKYIINDLIVEGENGKTSQIDHILINKNGIFVIETKNYSGRIYGNESQLQWTQVLNYGKVKNKIYNPVKQNATHIYRIKEQIGTKYPIKSLVVFVQGNTQYVDSDKVYTISQMKKQIENDNCEIIGYEEMQNLYEKILYLKKNNTTALQEHIENSNKTIKNIEEGICPRCGGVLKERHGQYGVFYGCSNYPKCKFKKK